MDGFGTRDMFVKCVDRAGDHPCSVHCCLFQGFLSDLSGCPKVPHTFSLQIGFVVPELFQFALNIRGLDQTGHGCDVILHPQLL